MKIGIIGGSFDPIHYGHLIMAEHLRICKNLEKIIFIPTGKAPHKNYLTTSQDRIKMVDLAISENTHFISSNIEASNRGVSYTIDTLKSLRENNKDSEFYFIIGLDNLFHIEEWKDFQGLASLTKFIVANRLTIDWDEDKIREKCASLERDYGFQIEIVDTPIIEISSSDLRERIGKGLSINYLTPQGVIDYIRENNLYERNGS